jgi:crotonobetainyl-CoA:carnitine CoA-transferase CaiB-like acyl-CoA transferase
LLEGIRVLEISHAVAGPTASQILADYGAEIIKIEKPGTGDIFRDVPGMGPTMFLAVNRGKKSVALDLKSREGLQLFYRLVSPCDVVIENMGPGVAAGLGVNYSRIRKKNSRAIYCKIESYGSGPYGNVPAFDPVLQAATGIMSTTGFPPERYARAGVSIVDMAAGMHAAIGILALLLNKRMRNSRSGAELKVSLYDAASYFMSYWVASYDLFKRDTTPLGSTHVFGSPYNLFKTRNGFVYLAVASDSAWSKLCESLSFPDLLADARFKTSSGRVLHKKKLEHVVSRRIAKLTNEDLFQKLKHAEVPFGIFNTVESLLSDPHFLGRRILKQYSFGRRKFRTVVNPGEVNGSRVFARGPPPELGADTRAVLTSMLHISKRRLDELESKGVIG